MTGLARHCLIAVYQAHFPTAPTWAEGPLVLRHRSMSSTAAARNNYYRAKAARILYGTADTPRRWHDSARRRIGDIEILGVEALRMNEGYGLVAVHLRCLRGTPIELLRSLAGRRDAAPVPFDPQTLVDGQAKMEPDTRPYTVSFATHVKGGLPRLYRSMRYRRWPVASQWLWSMASRTNLEDYPPDPKNLEPADSDIIRLSVDWQAIVLRDGAAIVGLRPDQGHGDPFFGYAAVYVRSIYLDAILLGLLHEQALTALEERMMAALDSSMAATMAALERDVSFFRHQLWAQHLTPHGIPNRLLSAYQREHALRDRFDQILTEISDFNRLARDDESRSVNATVVVFTLLTVPVGIALALLQVLETDDLWLITTVSLACLLLTALLLRTRSARLAIRALRRRLTQ
ncbi:hypothetical protein C1I98_12995 [Spongiactinospora gelatinilytica]|uniref:CorA-like Mg2+ transporter protein n=2 Tax=Spongiactinospora gelatinilytica TaxID=2666298 RepID=A0A2W2GEJ6_9ACTN|nr:hypothetical protein C1I98_12995 [Spongiactinospora gelatinilytica]